MKYRRWGVGLLALILALAGAAVWLTQPFVAPIPAAQNQPSADAARLRQHVEYLAGPLAQRDHVHTAVLNRAASYIQEHLTKAGGRVSLRRYSVDGSEYANVVARFGPEHGAPIVVGAHYDVNDGTPGADDNASGIAGLLELARLLSKLRLDVPIELVAYTLEEPPYFRTEHMGSRHHAKALSTNGVQPRLVLVLEMIGYFDDKPGSQQYPVPLMDLLYPGRGDFIAVVGHAGNAGVVRGVKGAMQGGSVLPMRSINAPSWVSGVDFSDHASYWRHDIPAVMVTDTSFYRNPHYHEIGDVPATLDYGRMALVMDGVAAAVFSFMSDGELKIKNNDKEKQ